MKKHRFCQNGQFGGFVEKSRKKHRFLASFAHYFRIHKPCFLMKNLPCFIRI